MSVEVFMWQQIGGFSRYTSDRRRRGLVWQVMGTDTWRWEYWEGAVEEPVEYGLVGTDVEARSIVEAMCANVSG